jgi:LytR cell envelope-related transcriptional attenuator
MPQNTAIMSPPRRPWYRGRGASPRYVVLAVAGLLIVGGAGVFAADQLLSDDSASPSTERPSGGGGGDQAAAKDEGGEKRRPVVPGNVTVAVLNGTTVPNLAKQVGDRVEAHGFVLGTVANSADQEQQRAESVVLYAPGHQREARAVNKRLEIGQRERIDPASQELAGDATVVVIAGADLAQ